MASSHGLSRLLLRRPLDRSARRRRSRLSRRRPSGIGRSIEALEDRTTPTTLTWVGDVDNLWNSGTSMVNTNWDTNTLPADGDTLIFPAGGANQGNINNTTAGNSYSLQFTGGAYTIGGNSITLDNTGTDILRTAGGAHVLGMALTLVADSTIEVSPVAGFLQLNGVLSGSNLIKTGVGDLLLNSSSSNFTGTTDIQTGRLQIESGGSINSSGTVTVRSGALLATSSTGSVNAPVNGLAGSVIQTFFAGGSLTLGNGTTSGFATAGNIEVVNNSTITLVDSNVALLGPSTLLGGGTAKLIAANGISLSAGDVLSGNGTVQGNVTTNSGTITPGTGPGRITVDGNLNLSNGTYVVEVNGATPATQHDQIVVTMPPPR